MTHRHQAHAQHVVDTFKNMLSESGRQHIGAKHFDELSLLIESAISASVLEQMEHAADDLEQLAQRLRKNAEHFDAPVETS